MHAWKSYRITVITPESNMNAAMCPAPAVELPAWPAAHMKPPSDNISATAQRVLGVEYLQR